MAEQVLVTGGTGFIGRHLVRRLLARGEAVRVFTRQPDLAAELFGSQVEIATGDLRDTTAVEAAIPFAGTVYHVGGLYRFGPGHRRNLRETNITGTRNVLRAAVGKKAARVVHVSTAGLLYRPEGLIQTFDFHRPPAGCHYKQSKWEAEKLALEAGKEGLPVIIASPTCPVGAEDDAPTPTGQMILDFLAGRYHVSCRAGLNLIDVEDLAGGLLACAESGQPGQRYLLGHENLSLDRLLALLEDLTGIPAPRHRLPTPVLHAVGWVCEAVKILHPGNRFCSSLCRETAVYAGRRQYFDVAPSWQALSWKPVADIRSSLRRAVEWNTARERGALFHPTCSPAPV